MYKGSALLNQVLGGGPSIRSQKEALDSVIERLDREIAVAEVRRDYEALKGKLPPPQTEEQMVSALGLSIAAVKVTK